MSYRLLDANCGLAGDHVAFWRRSRRDVQGDVNCGEVAKTLRSLA